MGRALEAGNIPEMISRARVQLDPWLYPGQGCKQHKRERWLQAERSWGPCVVGSHRQSPALQRSASSPPGSPTATFPLGFSPCAEELSAPFSSGKFAFFGIPSYLHGPHQTQTSQPTSVTPSQAL